MTTDASHKHPHKHPHPHRHAIAKHDINALPLKSYTGPIHVIDADAKMGAAVRALAHEKVLGFDTETRPAFKKGESYSPSLVQLAAVDAVYIFQLQHIRSYEPLADILGNKDVVKTGIAIHDDIRKLKEVFSHGVEGFVELAHLAAGAGIKNAGVRGLAALLFGFRISKGTRCSPWNAPALTEQQIVYAATDAWICREIYFALVGKSHEKKAGHA